MGNRRHFIRTNLTLLAGGIASQFLWNGCVHEPFLPEGKLLQPQPGASLPGGRPATLAWEATAASNLLVSFSAGAEWETLFENLPAGAVSREWLVPPERIGESCCFRLQSTAGVLLDDCSADFPIIQSILALQAPLAGQEWLTGQEVFITWTSAGVERVNLYYSTTNGFNWKIIASDIEAASGSFGWTVPLAPSRDARIRIENAKDPSQADTGTGVFSIIGVYDLALADHPELAVPGGRKTFQDIFPTNFAVIHLGNESFQVLDLTCTHQECQVEWRPDQQYYRCPCHVSLFGPSGCLLGAGPATLPLSHLEHAYDSVSGILRVILKKVSNPSC